MARPNEQKVGKATKKQSRAATGRQRMAARKSEQRKEREDAFSEPWRFATPPPEAGDGEGGMNAKSLFPGDQELILPRNDVWLVEEQVSETGVPEYKSVPEHNENEQREVYEQPGFWPRKRTILLALFGLTLFCSAAVILAVRSSSELNYRVSFRLMQAELPQPVSRALTKVFALKAAGHRRNSDASYVNQSAIRSNASASPWYSSDEADDLGVSAQNSELVDNVESQPKELVLNWFTGPAESETELKPAPAAVKQVLTATAEGELNSETAGAQPKRLQLNLKLNSEDVIEGTATIGSEGGYTVEGQNAELGFELNLSSAEGFYRLTARPPLSKSIQDVTGKFTAPSLGERGSWQAEISVK